MADHEDAWAWPEETWREIVRKMRAGREIGIHGWIHERNSTLAPATERDLQMRSADVLEIFKAEFDGAYEERGLYVLTMHPHIIGHRSRIRLLDALIEHIKDHHGVWFATDANVARYCLEATPDVGGKGKAR